MPQLTNAFLTNLPLANLKAAHGALMEWYAAHGRKDLPWRITRDPYAIYISEIMLQQTQVKTVLERYYSPFLARFPTLAALAAAPREAVLKQWEGLGYYTRAANLHKAALASGGTMPATVEGLLALPGIGRNTAHAVASFGFGVPVPVMEANVKRVIYRIFALPQASDAELWEKAAALMDTAHPFEYNQAMMDIGALICTRRAPRCIICPLNVICQGKTAPERYPAPKATKTVPERRKIIVVFQSAKGNYYLIRRSTRFLQGLYGFMEYGEDSRKVEFLNGSYALKPAQRLSAVTQMYSHFTLQASVYRVTVPEAPDPLPEGMVCVSAPQIAGLPLSRADLKIVAMLQNRL